MVRDTFIKKKWDVNDSFFYVHFHDDTAVRQLERYPHRILKFSRKWNDRLFDQSLAEMELNPNDMISEEEFESVWNNIEIKPLVTFIPEGDIFEVESVHSYAHGCNCAGAMGRGIATQFKQRYPAMYKEYYRLCKEGKFRPGDVYDYDYGNGHIYNLGTQETWQTKAKLEYIANSLEKMLTLAEKDQVSAIALPAIGAGLGGLKWEDVKVTVKDVARYHPSVDLYVVESYKGT